MRLAATEHCVERGEACVDDGSEPFRLRLRDHVADDQRSVRFDCEVGNRRIQVDLADLGKVVGEIERGRPALDRREATGFLQS